MHVVFPLTPHAVTRLSSVSGVALPSSSLPESVASDKSFGSTGSGGAVVGSRRNSTASTRASSGQSVYNLAENFTLRGF